MREEEMCVFLRIAIFDELKDCAIELSRSVGRAIGHVHIVDSVPDRTALNEAKVPALMSIALGQRNGLQALILSGGTFPPGVEKRRRQSRWSRDCESSNGVAGSHDGFLS